MTCTHATDLDLCDACWCAALDASAFGSSETAYTLAEVYCHDAMRLLATARQLLTIEERAKAAGDAELAADSGAAAKRTIGDVIADLRRMLAAERAAKMAAERARLN